MEPHASPSPLPRSPSSSLPWRLPAAVALATVAIYLPVVRNQFVPWDDNRYLYENPHITPLSWGAVRWAFTTFHCSNYHPLTWLSHALDVALWGLNPAPHHLTNAVLHAANGALFLLLAYRLLSLAAPRWQAREVRLAAAAAALLFVLHPLRVESVAWAAERKDVLCGLFCLLTCLAYLAFATRGGGRRYGLTLALFAAALLAKPMAITLPLVLLLVDRFPLRRPAAVGWSRLGAEKLPLFALSAASAALTLRAQQAGGAVSPLDHLPVAARLANAVRGICFYLEKSLLPLRLSPLYEPRLHPPLGPYLIAAAVVVTITLAAVVRWRRGDPTLGTAWLAYLVLLAPVLGVVQAGRQVAADRYTYLPTLPLALLTGAGVAVAWRRLACTTAGRTIALVVAAAVVAALATLTVGQIAVWHDGETLWRHAVACDPDHAFQAHEAVGILAEERGDLATAIREYQRAIAIHPRFVDALDRLGIALAREGDLAGAEATFHRALEVTPADSVAHANLGHLRLKQRRIPEAIDLLTRAVAEDPTFAKAQRLLGTAYLMAGDPTRAAATLRAALEVEPASFTAWNNLGLAEERLGHRAAAATAYRKALALRPERRDLAARLGALTATPVQP